MHIKFQRFQINSVKTSIAYIYIYIVINSSSFTFYSFHNIANKFMTTWNSSTNKDNSKLGAITNKLALNILRHYVFFKSTTKKMVPDGFQYSIQVNPNSTSFLAINLHMMQTIPLAKFITKKHMHIGK